MTKTLADISEAMRDVDFCVLTARAQDGSIGGRPMSNNRQVTYEGTSWFFAYDNTHTVQDLARDNAVGLTYLGSPGLKGILGAPGMFIHVEGEGRVIKDKARFAEHWQDGLDRWFPQGIDTPGLTLLEIAAKRIHYWDGGEEGEVKLPGTVAA